MAFCFDHLSQHRTDFSREFDQRQNEHKKLQQELADQILEFRIHPALQRIDQWRKESIEKIEQVAQYYRHRWIKCSKWFHLTIEKKLIDLAHEMDEINHGNEFNETDLKELKVKFKKLQKELHENINVSVEERPTSFIHQISLIISTTKDTRWKPSARTIAGGNHRGDRLDQLSNPFGICVDEHNQMIYVADCNNNRIMEYTLNETHGRIAAGGNERGNRWDQLSHPTAVIIDRENNDLIIADRENRRVMRWFRHTSQHGHIIIKDIDCIGLAIDKDGSLYVSDYKKHEVRRWEKGHRQGILVAGGNGEGDRLNQLNYPTFLFVDDEYNLYISDTFNHRVMKWTRDGKEGIIVAGGNGQGKETTHLSLPHGIVVDHFDQIYVVDWGNDRIMRWCEEAKEGVILVGDNGRGEEANQLNTPAGLSMDRAGNLYVADYWNNRIQRWKIE